VRINGKQDENTIEDLNYDMQAYKQDFPTAQFSELNLATPNTRHLPGQCLSLANFTNMLPI